ncbi:MAG: peptidylprolyl isomerase [Pseudomonadales bacterium]|nr:peptidylprolyl isomerase [Pseudomonadales bacterium]
MRHTLVKFSVTALLAIALGLSLASTAMAENTRLLITTNKGQFKIELYDQQAPITVKNFLSYVDSGFYKGTIFHRLIPGFMIQGGGFTKELAQKDTKAAIKNEAKVELKNLRGTLAMARRSSPDSATSQFFINYIDNPHLDYRDYNVGYAVFGKVENMSVIDAWENLPTGTISIYNNVPKDAIEILNIEYLK